MRPYVLLSVATSLDGYIDDKSAERLLLSNAADFDRVDEVRAGVDAIMIGAQTMRADNPRLLVNSDERRANRVRQGKPAYPLKVTISRSGNLSRELKFWHHGGEKLVYTTEPALDRVRAELNGLAEVVALGVSEVDIAALLDDLGDRRIARLMVEGGGTLHTEFLSRGLADELHLAIAPIIVGQRGAPRFLYDGNFPLGRMELAESRQIGDVALMRYLPKHVSSDVA